MSLSQSLLHLIGNCVLTQNVFILF
jgi:hypothetical protein